MFLAALIRHEGGLLDVTNRNREWQPMQRSNIMSIGLILRDPHEWLSSDWLIQILALSDPNFPETKPLYILRHVHTTTGLACATTRLDKRVWVCDTCVEQAPISVIWAIIFRGL